MRAVGATAAPMQVAEAATGWHWAPPPPLFCSDPCKEIMLACTPPTVKETKTYQAKFGGLVSVFCVLGNSCARGFCGVQPCAAPSTRVTQTCSEGLGRVLEKLVS